MHALGRQILVEFYDCSQERINSSDFIESSMLEATAASGATIISHDFHTFSPHGVSGVIVIAESHVTIHTWPEHGYAAVDAFMVSHRYWTSIHKLPTAHLLKCWAMNQLQNLRL